MKRNDVVQFTEEHKWCGCFGFIDDIRDKKIIVGVPVPEEGIAFIVCSKDGNEFEVVGRAVLVTKED